MPTYSALLYDICNTYPRGWPNRTKLRILYHSASGRKTEKKRAACLSSEKNAAESLHRQDAVMKTAAAASTAMPPESLVMAARPMDAASRAAFLYVMPWSHLAAYSSDSMKKKIISVSLLTLDERI